MFIVLFALIFAVSALAGPFQQKYVSSDANWIIHADVEKFSKTQIGGFVLNEFRSEEANKKFAAFQVIFNFDPRKDLKSLTLYGPNNNPKQAVALIRGTFDADRLTTLLRANDTYSEIRYHNHIVHSWIDKENHKGKVKSRKEPSFGCFHPNGIVVLGTDLEPVKKALDVMDGKKPSLKTTYSFHGLSLPGQPSFLAAVANLSEMGELGPKATVLKQAKSINLALEETGGNLRGHLILSTRTAVTATRVQAVVEGMIAIALLVQEENPELARLAQELSVSVDNKTVRVSLDSPASDILAVLQKQIEQSKAKNQPTP